MPKRVFIIHGWGGSPGEHWMPWLKKELEGRGIEVYEPAMPDTDNPVIDKWVNKLSEIVGVLDENTFFVGHSIGCQAILRYLETQGVNKAGGCVLVAGFFTLQYLDEEEEEAIAEPWVTNQINFERVKKASPNMRVILSDNDKYVSVPDNKPIFKDKLDAEVLVLEKKGHFTTSDGVVELPEVLTAIESLSS